MSDDVRQKIIIITDDKQLKDLVVNLERVSTTGKKVGKSVTTSGKQMGSSWKVAQGHLKGLLGELGGMVPMLGKISRLGPAAIFAGIGIGMLKATQEASKFEHRMAEVLTLVDTTKVSAQKLTQEIIALSTRGPTGLIDLTEGLYDLVSAGVDANRSIQVLDVAMRSAVAGVTDAEVAIDGITSAMNAWGYQAEQAEDISNSFFVAVRNGKTTFSELSASIGQLGPIAAATGVGLDTALAGVAAITTAGVRTNLAMTQMRSLLIAVARQVPQTVKVAKEMGAAFTVADLRTKGLRQFLDDLLLASGGDETKLTRLVGRIEALNAILQLSGSQSAKFSKNLDDMTNKAGSMQDAYEKMRGTLITVTATIRNQLSAAMTKIGLRLIPMVTARLQDFSDALRSFDSPLRKMVDRLNALDVDPNLKFRMEVLLDIQESEARLEKLRRDMRSTKFVIPVEFGTSDSWMTPINNYWNTFWQQGAQSVDKNSWWFTAFGGSLVEAIWVSLRGFSKDMEGNWGVMFRDMTKDLVNDPAFSFGVSLKDFDLRTSGIKETEDVIAGLLDGIERMSTEWANIGDADSKRAKNLTLMTDMAEESYRFAVEALAQKRLEANEEERILALRAEASGDNLAQRREREKDLEVIRKTMQVESDAYFQRVQGLSEIRQHQEDLRRLDDINRKKMEARMKVSGGVPQEFVDRELKIYDEQVALLNLRIEGSQELYDEWQKKVDDLNKAMEKGRTTLSNMSDELAEASAPSFLGEEIKKSITLRKQMEELREAIDTMVEAKSNAMPEGIEWTPDKQEMLDQSRIIMAGMQVEAAKLADRIRAEKTFAPVVQSILDGIGDASLGELDLDDISDKISAEALSDVIEDVLKGARAKVDAEAGKILIGLPLQATEEERAAADAQIEALYQLARERVGGLGAQIMAFFPQAVEGINLIADEMERIGIPEGKVTAQIKAITAEMERGMSIAGNQFGLGLIDEKTLRERVKKFADEAKARLDEVFGQDGSGLTLDQLKAIKDIIDQISESAEDAETKLEKFLSTAAGVEDLLGSIHDLASGMDGVGEAALRAIGGVVRLAGAVRKAGEAQQVMAETKEAGKDPTLGMKFSAAAGMVGVVSAVAGFVSGIRQASKERQRQHLAEMRRMIDLERQLRANTHALRQQLDEQFKGGIAGAGIKGSDLAAGANILQQDPAAEINRIIRDGIRAYGPGNLGAIKEALERARGVALDHLQAIEELGIDGLDNLQETFNTALDSGMTVAEALATALEPVKGFIPQISDALGRATKDVAGAVQLFNDLVNMVGLDPKEALGKMLAFLDELDLGEAFDALVARLASVDISTEDGQKAFREIVAEIKTKMLAGQAGGLLENVTSEELDDLLSTWLGVLPDVSENLATALQSAVDALGVFTGLLGKEGVEAFRFFIDRLLANEDELGKDLSDALRLAKGFDLSSQEGQNQLAALVESMALSILAGTSSDDFGIPADELLSIAEQLKRLGKSAFEDGFTSSTTALRTVTEIQGNEMIIILNSIDHGIRSLVSSATGVSLSSRQQMPALPASMTHAFDALSAQSRARASVGPSTRNAIEMKNFFDIDVSVAPSIEAALVEMGKKVTDKYNRVFPRR